MENLTPEQKERIDEIKAEIHKILETYAKAEAAADELKKLWEEIKAIQNQNQRASPDPQKQIEPKGL